jgi:hypothetical protein
MNSGVNMLLILVASVALATTLVLVLFRFATKLLGLQQVLKDGVVLTESGLEFLGFLWIVKMKAHYTEVESVELLPYYTGLISFIFFRYGFTSHWICKRTFSDIVLINLKGSRIYKNLLFTPKDAPAFVEQLRRRIKETQTSSPQVSP